MHEIGEFLDRKEIRYSLDDLHQSITNLDFNVHKLKELGEGIF